MGVKNEFIKEPGNLNYSLSGKYRQAKKIFLYNYEQLPAADIKLPTDVTSVVLLEYFAVIKKGDIMCNYIKKPFDIFKIYDVLFNDHSYYFNGNYFKNVPVIALTANDIEGVMEEYKKLE